MKTRGVLLLIFLICLLQLFFSKITVGENAEYSLIMRTDKKVIDPGENLTLRIYVSGYGTVNNSKILFYTSTDFKTSYSFFGGEALQQSTDVPVTFIYPMDGFINCAPYWSSQVPYGEFVRCSEFDSSLQQDRNGPFIKVVVSNINLEGNHEVMSVLSYQDTSKNWHSVDSTINFHVTTLQERFWWIGVPATIIIGVLGWIVAIVLKFNKSTVMSNIKS
jgi:hypothetical protein